MTAEQAEALWREAFEALKQALQLPRGQFDPRIGAAEIEAWHQYRAALMCRLAEITPTKS